MLQPHLGNELPFPGFLVMHADIGGEQGLKESRHERGVGQHTRGQIGQIGHGLPAPSELWDKAA
jgi:hypothetical protein